jgi:hypothetical protein
MKALVGIGLGGITLGLVLLVGGLRRFRRTYVTDRWRCVTARVISADIVPINDRLGPALGTSYVARVMYRYEAEGRTYEALLEDTGISATSDASNLRRLWAEYPIGRALEVCYNPSTPELSALPGTSPIGAVLRIVGGGVLLCAGIACEVLYFGG